jgi:hypothetical protein
MLHRTLLVALLSLSFALPVAGQAVDRKASVAALAGLAARDEAARWPLRVPEPPEWMVWLCGLAVAGVIALRRVRSGGLSE